MAWVRLQYSGGRGCPAKWVLGKVISKAFAKISDVRIPARLFEL